jgi:hypothetical protein
MALAAAAIGQIMNLSRSLLTPLLLMAFRDLEALALLPINSNLLCHAPSHVTHAFVTECGTLLYTFFIA